MTDRNEYTLKAHIVACAKEFTAKPGDPLVIVGDMCLGLLRPGTHVVARIEVPTIGGRPAKAAPKRRKPDPLPTPKSTRRTTIPTEDELVRLLGKHGTLTARRASDLLNISRGAVGLRASVGYYLRKLVNTGTVARTDDPRGHTNLTTYTLVSQPKEQSNAAA